MPAGLCFALKYFSFTHRDTRLQRHNLVGPFDDIITGFDPICKAFPFSESALLMRRFPEFARLSF